MSCLVCSRPRHIKSSLKPERSSDALTMSLLDPTQRRREKSHYSGERENILKLRGRGRRDTAPYILRVDTCDKGDVKHVIQRNM